MRNGTANTGASEVTARRHPRVHLLLRAVAVVVESPDLRAGHREIGRLPRLDVGGCVLTVEVVGARRGLRTQASGVRRVAPVAVSIGVRVSLGAPWKANAVVEAAVAVLIPAVTALGRGDRFAHARAEAPTLAGACTCDAQAPASRAGRACV